MSNLFLALIVIILFSFISCKKENNEEPIELACSKKVNDPFNLVYVKNPKDPRRDNFDQYSLKIRDPFVPELFNYKDYNCQFLKNDRNTTKLRCYP